MSASTTSPTSLQELLQREYDTFIPDKLDDQFYDDNTYNWEVMFETVKLFVLKEGRWPRMHRKEDKRKVVWADGEIVLRNLARWMSNQRTRKFNGKLSDARERKLNSIRFMWDQREHEWHALFCAVKDFKKTEGRWPRLERSEDKREVVLADGVGVLRDLGMWLSRQKQAKSDGELLPERERKLDSIDVTWDKYQYEWNAMFDAVKYFKKEVRRWPRQGRSEDKRMVFLADGKAVLRDLAAWCNSQKRLKTKNKLDPSREKKLNSIGFVWGGNEYAWNAMFCAVKDFKEKEGRWPRWKRPEDKREVVSADGKTVPRNLSVWMGNQKRFKRKGTLPPLREKKLNDIDFPFQKGRKRARTTKYTGMIKKQRSILSYQYRV